MYAAASYDDVLTEVRTELSARVDDALAAGVAREQLVLDPGLGFAKTGAHNWALLAQLDRLVDMGLPVLIGASRKTFLGRLLAGPDGTPRPAEQRDAATLATTVLAAQAGVWGVRVHDAAGSVDALRTLTAVRAAGEPARG
jgi:dihydropteroate synthase